jgi:hypothetical protein
LADTRADSFLLLSYRYLLQYDRSLPLGSFRSRHATYHRQHHSPSALYAYRKLANTSAASSLIHDYDDFQVLRAVTTYRSLVGYVSTTLLSRLITKKVWTNPQLWVGFMRCAKTIAPASFSALMQLPREQLKEILERQPEMKPGMWQYVLAKNGPVKAQTYAEVSCSHASKMS